ncbi:hypothetical protein HCN50_32975 [Bradyrhizobium sp. WSM 1744]|uniref:Uncharacterized protein n=1 Tax=Bradyrhizobium archetypum TaxID=2721160 RepID=A0A7Y4HB21_9BRAD|nr:hypothetical protein [Bradyrhizobium archetypum]
MPTEMHRLKELEDENAMLEKVVADLSMDNAPGPSVESSEAYPEAQAGP